MKKILTGLLLITSLQADYAWFCTEDGECKWVWIQTINSDKSIIRYPADGN